MPSFDGVDSALSDGIALFNQGRYYDCHDVLEAIWMEAETLEKPFYQGILQIAVGLYHLGNHNWQGASILLGEGVNRLRPFEPNYRGVAVAALVDCGWAWLTALQQTGISHITELAQALDQHQGRDSDALTEITIPIGGKPLILPIPAIYSVEEPNSDD